MRLIPALICIALLLGACKEQQSIQGASDSGSAQSVVDPPKCPPLEQGKIEASDPMSSLAATINGDCIELKFSYSGGCKEHQIQLFWTGHFTETMPPHTSVFLAHDANDDHCRGIQSGKLTYDLTDLQYEGVGQVVIDVRTEGARFVRLNYTY